MLANDSVDGNVKLSILDVKLSCRVRWLLLLFAVLALWLPLVATSIWRFGHEDFAKKSDCIIVLGAAVNGRSPSPVFEERLRHGIDLYQRGLAPKLLITGGKGEGKSFAEGEVGMRYALANGVPSQALLKETISKTTNGNLREAQRVMRAEGLQSAIVVSDPLHLKRASLMARGLGLNVVTSPTPTTRYRSLRTQLGFLMRELYFVHHYLVFRK